MEPEGQRPPVESTVHELAKPVMRGLAWSSVLAGAAALGLATWRNVQGR